MQVESRFLPRLGPNMLMTFRSWKAALLVGMTLLLLVPLYQLRDYSTAVEYKDYIYKHISKYLHYEGGVYNNTLYQEGAEDTVLKQFNFSAPCKDFPDTNGILLVMKTGATEAFDKLPTQLLTSMQCLPDFLLFSDLVRLFLACGLSVSCGRNGWHTPQRDIPEPSKSAFQPHHSPLLPEAFHPNHSIISACLEPESELEFEPVPPKSWTTRPFVLPSPAPGRRMLTRLLQQEQQIGRYHIYNVLDRVNDTIKAAKSEFRLYDAQQACPVSQKDCTSGMRGAWDLDKYKFLNMVERTWSMRPDMEWYVFAEADTYVVWSNLVHWLRERADPVESPYVGSVALINGFPFAHGGSGYVVSGAFMKKMVELIPELAAKYDEKATTECCGDLLISMALDEVGAKVKQAHPMFNGEKPNTLPYGPGHWCEPILTMHHMNPEEVSAVWQYEQTRTKSVSLSACTRQRHALS